MKRFFATPGTRCGSLVLISWLLSGLAVAGVNAASTPQRADPAVSKAIGLIGDLYRTGEIDRTGGDAALSYYVDLSNGDGRILATIPPDQLMPGVKSDTPPDGESSVRVYQLAANLGNPDAFLRLGDLYVKGDLIAADQYKAFSYYQQAAKLGSKTASVNIGLMMIAGTGTELDVPGGLKRLNAAADEGNAQALMALGNLYRTGGANGIKPDAQQSFDYYKRASDGGDIEAAIITARMMIDGEGTAASPETGYEIVRRLYEQKEPSALLLMGDIQLSGIPGFLPPDADKAYESYAMAAEAGSATGRAQMALMLVHGQGVSQNAEAGLQALQELAQTGNLTALNMLGQIFENGVPDAVSADVAQAFSYYKIASDEGDPGSKLRMASMMLEGKGTLLDVDSGIAILEGLAGNGSSDANLILAEFYAGAIGNGTSKDLAKAFSYYRTAADAGSGTAQVQTALMLLRGEGTEQNQKTGMELLQDAADKGNPDALIALGTIFQSGEAGTVDAEAAVSAFEAAAALGADKAYILLGDLYSRGEVMTADGELAVYYYEKAAGLHPSDDSGATNKAVPK